MVNFYRRFLPRAAELQAPLINILANTQLKGAKPVPWTPEAEMAFQKCKDHLTKVTLLAHPDNTAPVGLFTDASSTHVGACLQQRIDDDWQPLAFFSKKLTTRQSTWPAYYRELLAVYEAVQHFRHVLEAQHVTIYTDHKPLIYAFSQRREKLPPPQLNQLTFISQFTTSIVHVSGKDNVVADTMSRVESINLLDDYGALAKDQENDSELKEMISKSSLKLEKVPIPGKNLSIFCDTSTGKPRPYLTPPFRRAYFNKLHDLSHPGARGSARLVTDRFIWPGINKDCREWARFCTVCQRSKVTRHTSAPIGNITSPTKRFRHIHIDIIGPLPPSSGYQYCLTAIDRYTRWPEAWPMSGITAEEVAETFFREWISRYGVPQIVTTDQGRQFESALFQSLMQFCSTTRTRTTSYHPCANGLVERMHRTLKAALMCHDASWSKALPAVLLGMRSALKDDIQASPADLVYGEPLRLPGEFIIPPDHTETNKDVPPFISQLRRHISLLRPIPVHRHGQKRSFVFKDLETSTHVWLRDDTVRPSLKPPYSGPFKVVKRTEKTYTITMGDKTVVVSIDRLKPAFIEVENNPKHCTSNTTTPLTNTEEDPAPVVKRVTQKPYTTRSGRKVTFKTRIDV
ncbi:hypothetical protein O3G_MSEX000172 [Manduca sexta]|nr:hypothetical protein O3G_MSEX000172 [Manduca sexta]